MTTLTATQLTARAGTPRLNTARIYVTEARHEFLKLIRVPIFAVSTIALPVLFYLLFGVAFGGGPGAGDAGPVGVTTYMMATYGTFGVIGAALFGFGVSVAARTWAGLDAAQARLTDAPAGLLRGQGRHGDVRVGAHHRGAVHPRGARWVACGCPSPSGSASAWCCSSGRCRSRPWAWPSATSSARTPHRPC